MLKLPDVTLVAITGLGYKADAHLNAIKRSSEKIQFGDTKLIQLGAIKSLDDYSYACIYELPKYIETDFCLLVQWDGFVANPDKWDSTWLQYDYIGAPWPLPQDPVSYRDKNGNLRRVGNGGFSLRSKRLMDAASYIPWQSYNGCFNEDGFICVNNVHILEKQGLKIAPLEVAKHFAREFDIPESVDEPFGFHFNKANPGRNEKYRNIIQWTA